MQEVRKYEKIIQIVAGVTEEQRGQVEIVAPNKREKKAKKE